jgi:hypothetical protein
MNKVFGLVFTIFFFVPVLARAGFDFEKLKNDKEVEISSFSKGDQKDILKKFPDQPSRDKVKSIFNKTLKDFLGGDTNQCELSLIKEFKSALKGAQLPDDEKSVESYLRLMRIQNVIDDIFYDVLSSDNRDFHDFLKVKLTGKVKKAPKSWAAIYEKNDLKELYSNFEPFPDEISHCAYQEYIYLKNKIVNSEGLPAEKPLEIMEALNKKAFEEKIIGLESYHKIEFLREKSEVNKRYILMRDYLQIISSAKNQMIPVNRVYKPLTLEREDKFSTERMKRFSRLTRRKLLYRKYDETQIILLSQILQKASRRMGVDVDTKTGVPYVTQEFEVTGKDGEHTTYVEKLDLDPQSQFNLARRLMRKDLTETQMMETFIGLRITYEDIVMAAFETGYITIEDLTYVVRYDDLWNPKVSKFERVSGLIFKVSGYATFFLPAPWNVVGTLALGVVEGIVDAKTKSGADHDNPATFIE